MSSVAQPDFYKLSDDPFKKLSVKQVVKDHNYDSFVAHPKIHKLMEDSFKKFCKEQSVSDDRGYSSSVAEPDLHKLVGDSLEEYCNSQISKGDHNGKVIEIDDRRFFVGKVSVLDDLAKLLCPTTISEDDGHLLNAVNHSQQQKFLVYEKHLKQKQLEIKSLYQSVKPQHDRHGFKCYAPKRSVGIQFPPKRRYLSDSK